MEAKTLLIQVRKHRLFILLFMILGFGAGMYYFDRFYNVYTAVVTLYISGEPVVDKADADDFYVDISDVNHARVIQEILLRSNDMTNILNEKFNLYNHYQLDSTSSYSYDKISTILAGCLGIAYKNQFNYLELTFIDKDPNFAIRVVNFVSKKLDEMNKKLLIEKLKKKASIYKMVLTDLDVQSNKIISRLMVQINAINKLLENINMVSSQSKFLLPMQSNLYSMTTDLKRISQKTINLNNAYQIAIRSINDDVAFIFSK